MPLVSAEPEKESAKRTASKSESAATNSTAIAPQNNAVPSSLCPSSRFLVYERVESLPTTVQETQLEHLPAAIEG